MLSYKTLAIERQAAQLRDFKLNKQKSLKVAQVPWIPGILFSRTIIQYAKEEVIIPDAGSLSVIKKGNEGAGFVWHMPCTLAKKALHYGILPVQSITAKAITALGAYRQQALTRAYEHGIISNKHECKAALVTLAQEVLTSLQGLELLVNTFNPSVSLDAEKSRIYDALDETINQLTIREKNLEHTLKSLIPFDKQAIETARLFVNQQITALQQLQQQITKASPAKIRHFFQATGVDSILTQVKIISLETLVTIQELNQNITYSRAAQSLLRGDLNGACEDALKAVRDYEADPHNPILAEHQGQYASGSEASETIAVDFSHLGNDEKAIMKVLRTIHQVSGKGIQAQSLPENTSTHFTLDGSPLLSTRFTKWATNANPGYLVKRMTAGIINIITGTVVGVLLDLPLGFFSSLFSLGRFKMSSLSSKLEITIATNAPQSSSFDRLCAPFAFKHYSAGTLIGQQLGTFLSNIVLDIATGIWQSTTQLFINPLASLLADFKAGAWFGSDASTHQWAVIQSDLHILKATSTAFLRRVEEKETALIRQYPKAITPQEAPALEPTSTRHASPSYNLTAGEWDDISNAGISGLITLNETFMHHIHAKHPFTGLLFSATYVAGGIAILAPTLASFLTHNYIAFAQMMGKLMAQGGTSSAIASGFTQAKLVAAVFESTLHGRDSWLALGAKQLEQDTANILFYTTLAIGLGYGLTHFANIPWLSDYLDEEAGTVPEIGWAFAGGKIGLLLVELLETHPDSTTAAHKVLRASLEEAIQQTLPNHEREAIRAIADELLSQTIALSPEKMGAFAKEIKQLQFLQLIHTHQHLLPLLDATRKRHLLSQARTLFVGLEDNDARIRGIKEALYPSAHKAIFTRTVTLVADYIPLTLRCLLSPLTRTLDPWRDLSDKVIKDITRIAHGLSKLTNTFFKTCIRVLFRGPLDILTNELLARTEGLIRNDTHHIASHTYSRTNHYEKSAELMRQFIAEPVDALRAQATAPTMEALCEKAQHETITQPNFSQRFFQYAPQPSDPNSSILSPCSDPSSSFA